MRGRAEGNVYSNDSVFVQFSNAVTSSGSATLRIGTTSAAEYNLEDCSGCGIAGWGWQDNGWGRNVTGAPIRFNATGPQKLRIQAREDGLSIDQIILSPSRRELPQCLARSAQERYDHLCRDRAFHRRNRSWHAAPAGALPGGWTSRDIGAVGVAGSASFDAPSSTFTLKGAGADIWGTVDALHYAYQTLSGDGTIVARVASVSSNAAWVKAGVMIGALLAADSPQAMMLVSYSKGLAFQRRTAAGGQSTSTPGVSSGAPYYVRLDRSGDTIAAYQSADGSHWALVGTDTLSMGSSAYVGLAISSHSTSSAATATFDHVSVQP